MLAAGREGEAREWFAKALEADRDGSTDASDRLAEMDGVDFVDALDEDEVETEHETESGENVVEQAAEAEAEAEEAEDSVEGQVGRDEAGHVAVDRDED